MLRCIGIVGGKQVLRCAQNDNQKNKSNDNSKSRSLQDDRKKSKGRNRTTAKAARVGGLCWLGVK
jgi:hypothetical protein